LPFVVQDTELDKKLRTVIKGLWGGGVSDVLSRLTAGGQEVSKYQVSSLFHTVAQVEHTNDSEICEELIYCSMENKVSMPANKNGNERVMLNPLVLCQVEQAEILLDAGASPNFTGPDMRTPLITAAAEGHAELVSLLLQYGADATKASKSGNTPLDYAKFYNHTAVAEVLSDPYLYRGSTCINPLFEIKRKVSCSTCSIRKIITSVLFRTILRICCWPSCPSLQRERSEDAWKTMHTTLHREIFTAFTAGMQRNVWRRCMGMHAQNSMSDCRFELPCMSTPNLSICKRFKVARIARMHYPRAWRVWRRHKLTHAHAHAAAYVPRC